MDLSELYAEVIIDHQRNPRNYGSLENSDKEVQLTNSSCGDEISLQVKFEKGNILDIAFHGHGCALSIASASIMTELVKGISKRDAKELCEKFIEMVQTGKHAFSQLKDARVFEGVSKYPLRAKCVTLAWHALKKALE